MIALDYEFPVSERCRDKQSAVHNPFDKIAKAVIDDPPIEQLKSRNWVQCMEEDLLSGQPKLLRICGLGAFDTDFIGKIQKLHLLLTNPKAVK